MPSGKTLAKFAVLSLLLFTAHLSPAGAGMYEAGNPDNFYGHLYQGDVPEIGHNACGPTSAVNSFTYLQNQFPTVYGTSLAASPPTVDDVRHVAGPDYMNVTADQAHGGAAPSLVVWGRYIYMESRAPLQTQYVCQVASRDGIPLNGDQIEGAWPVNRPLPDFLANTPDANGVAVPTWQFIYQNLQKGADLGVTIPGHALTLRSFSFEDKNNNGTIDKGEGRVSFVDPGTRAQVTCDMWENTDPGTLSGYRYLMLDIYNRIEYLTKIIAACPAPQAVPDAVAAGHILVLTTTAPYGHLTLRGGILCAVGPKTTWNKNLILAQAGGIFDTASAATLTGHISGPGTLNKTGPGTLFLRGTSSSTGGLLLSEGTVNIVRDESVGSPEAAITLRGGTLQAGASLTLYRPVAVQYGGVFNENTIDTGGYACSFNGPLQGSAALRQRGRGSLTLNGDASGFTGVYTLAGGALNLANTLGSSLDIKLLGLLKGSGLIVGAVTNEGTLNPGNPVGTLNLADNYIQAASSSLVIEVASATNFDRLILTGDYRSAQLDGALQPVLVSGYRPPARTVFPGLIIASGRTFPGLPPVSGTFASIAGNTPILTWQALYAPDRVDLTLTRDYAGPALGLNSNQRALGAMFNGVADTTRGDLAAVLNTLDQLPTGGAVADAYRQISPDRAGALPALSLAGATMQWRSLANRLSYQRWRQGGAPSLTGGGFGSFNLSCSRLEGLLLAYNGADLGGLVSAPRPEPGDSGRWGLYTDFVSAVGSQGSSANQSGYNFDIFGFTAGADYRLRDDLLLGVGSGYYHTSASYQGAGGAAAVGSIPFFAYAAYTPNAFYAMGSAGYTLNLYDLHRNLTFGGLSRTADGSVPGSQFNAGLETGYDLKFRGAVLTPAAALFYSQAWVDNFTESGGGALNLNVASQSADSLQTGLGLRLSRPCQTARAQVLPQVSAFYQHEFAHNSRGVDARLTQAGSTFTFTTDSPRRDFALLGAGVAVSLPENLTMQANYNVELGRGNYTPHFISAGLRWKF